MKVNTQPLSPEEEAARDVENRKSAAEAEFVIIANDKKRLLGEIENIKKVLAELETAKDSLNRDISKIQIEKDEYLNSHKVAKDAFEEITGKKSQFEREFSDFKIDAQSKKAESQAEIKSLQEKVDAARLELSNHLDISKFEKEKLLKEISRLNSSLSILLKQEVDQKDKNDNLITVHSELLRKKESLDTDISKYNAEISEKRDLVKSFESEVAKFKDDISDKKLEVQNLSNSIISKKAEYKVEETKLFAVERREVALQQKEKFIKAAYDRAGVKWDEQ